jgi:hypothetical protein
MKISLCHCFDDAVTVWTTLCGNGCTRQGQRGDGTVLSEPGTSAAPVSICAKAGTDPFAALTDRTASNSELRKWP